MEKTNGQILGTDTSQNQQNKIKIVPKNTIISLSTNNFNSLVHYSKHQAQLKQISDTVKAVSSILVTKEFDYTMTSFNNLNVIRPNNLG